MSAQPTARPYGLIGFYALFFMQVGVSLPFMPGYFQALGFTGAQSGALLSVDPMFAAFLPPLFGQLADRTRRPGVVLSFCATGSALGFLLLSQSTRFETAFLSLCVHAACAGGVASLCDILALHFVEQNGGSYARIRVWGSLGFVLSALPFGFLVTTIDRTAVLVPLALMSACSLLAFWKLAPEKFEVKPGPLPTLANAWAVMKKPQVAFFLVATAIHWVGFAPYNGSLAPHVTRLGLPPWVIGVSSSLGVVSEIVVMLTWPRWTKRFSPKRLLMISFVVASARWAMVAMTDDPYLLVATNVLHGITFGAFYLASVSWMVEHAPGSLRATGQAIYTTATFGIGGVIGYRVAGSLFDSLGGHRLFAIAAGVSLVPAIVLALMPEPDPSPKT